MKQSKVLVRYVDDPGGLKEGDVGGGEWGIGRPVGGIPGLICHQLTRG